MINHISVSVLVMTSMLVLSEPDCHAQFLEISNTHGWLRSINTLEVAGPKFIDALPAGTQATNLTIYNLDLSPYVTIPLPPPSLGGSYNAIGYVTEALFDTDPSTIEFMVFGNGAVPYVQVFSETGSIIFSLDSASFPVSSQGAIGGIIMDTENGAIMTLDRTEPAVNGSVHYQLPGHLPCLPCIGHMVGINGLTTQFEAANLIAFPNPTGTDALISYELPTGSTRGDLVFSDAAGSELLRWPIMASGTRRITVADIPAGTYFYRLETNQGMIGAKRLVVVK